MLSGWRGLLDPAVQKYFNRTFIAFQPDWGPDKELMRNLGLDFEVVHLGGKAESEIEQRLAAGIPTLFYLWSPHPLAAKFRLSRIQLPEYSPALFEAGMCDYPPGEPLAKVASCLIARIAPSVLRFYEAVSIDNREQISMMAAVGGDASSKDAACAWLRGPEGNEKRRKWLLDSTQCPVGFHLPTSGDIDGDVQCHACPRGMSSLGGDATGCDLCALGKSTPFPRIYSAFRSSVNL
jgi:ABC-type proline/glycine betaine transport system substrate-binding protein